MKRSLVFLGLCLMVAAGLTTAKQAKSSAKAPVATICCGFDGTPIAAMLRTVRVSKAHALRGFLIA